MLGPWNCLSGQTPTTHQLCASTFVPGPLLCVRVKRTPSAGQALSLLIKQHPDPRDTHTRDEMWGQRGIVSSFSVVLGLRNFKRYAQGHRADSGV